MVRTQVQLTEDQIRALRQISQSTGSSIADLVRQGVENYLNARQYGGRDRQIERALRVAGRFSSGSHDGSTQHDRHLAAAFRK
ncbi:MAG TPA: ribbon-helix-helix domain-containing protein [Bryobacteraceae bacterium]|nr:ribbon-helix-helix domain-containing protein [Bryobacteraceae bacterium]